ncbi:hypothetical protein [Bacillus massilinigeriensis]|uniref:hypothetical protein n=1 Tax=Bacillus mediterraneensis TaxID=1805474 RepID=UPI0008F85CAA|nr:hypothetical protein [Bacillus mediterraneensis]
METGSKFFEAYMERGNKETEEVLSVESGEFLKQRIDYFKKHKEEFLYVESELFDSIKADAISFESDDVFGNYDVMLGLQLQKKFGPFIEAFLEDNLKRGKLSYDLMFSADEGIWNMNIALDDVAGFHPDLTILEAYQLIYQFLEDMFKQMK